MCCEVGCETSRKETGILQGNPRSSGANLPELPHLFLPESIFVAPYGAGRRFPPGFSFPRERGVPAHTLCLARLRSELPRIHAGKRRIRPQIFASLSAFLQWPSSCSDAYQSCD